MPMSARIANTVAIETQINHSSRNIAGFINPDTSPTVYFGTRYIVTSMPRPVMITAL